MAEEAKAIRVLVFAPEQAPEISVIDGSLESMQKIVGGLVEFVTLDDKFSLVCNEEGKVLGLPTNRYVPVLRDVVCGTFFVVKNDDDNELIDSVDYELSMFEERLRP
jgi:hypothetical protein